MTLHWNPEMGSHHTPCIFTKYFKGHITRHLSLWLKDLWLYLPLCILAMVERAPHNRPHRLASFVWSSLSPLSVVPSLSGLVSYPTYISSWRLSTWHLVCIGLLLWAWFHFTMPPPLTQGFVFFTAAFSVPRWCLAWNNIYLVNALIYLKVLVSHFNALQMATAAFLWVGILQFVGDCDVSVVSCWISSHI